MHSSRTWNPFRFTVMELWSKNVDGLTSVYLFCFISQKSFVLTTLEVKETVLSIYVYIFPRARLLKVTPCIFKERFMDIWPPRIPMQKALQPHIFRYTYYLITYSHTCPIVSIIWLYRIRVKYIIMYKVLYYIQN